MKNVLCLNSGSSSLKFALYRVDAADERLQAHGAVERIGFADGRLWVQAGKSRSERSGHFATHRLALEAALPALEQRALPAFDAVGHRLVSGGARYFEPTRIDAEVRTNLEACVPFAPLHLPAALSAIDAVQATSGVPQIACFDTAFHRTMPERATRLPLPRTYWDEGLRNYGFHGLSFESIVGELDGAPGRTVIAHLGNGASLAAVRDGKSVDTTMGLTPTAGLIMGTRSGDIDPGVLLFLMNEKRLDATSLERLLNTSSGLLGISDISSDMQTLLGMRATEPRAAIAVELFCYSARKHIAAMSAALEGIDALVFTGGIGERAPAVRAGICSALQYLGIEIDADANARNERSIGNGRMAVRVQVIPTDEARVIARHSFRLLRS